MKEKRELQMLNEVGAYAMLDEEIGNEMTSIGIGRFVTTDGDEEEKEK